MLTTDELISDLKLRASIPETQALFSTERFIQILNSEMNTKIIPLIMRLNDSHFVTNKTVTLPFDRDYISFPSDGLGQSIVDIFINKGRVALIPLTEKERFCGGNGIYLEGYKIKFINPSQYHNKDIVIYYHKRPLPLISTSKTARVTSIDTNIIDVDTNVSSFVPSYQLEVISSIEPFESKGIVTISAKNSNKQYVLDNITFLEVGDYLSPKGYTPIPQIPLEAFELLSQRAVIKCLEALKDGEGLKNAMSDYVVMERELQTLLSPRTGNIPKKIGSSNSLWNSW
ncbi:hypothetical protein [Leptospira bandrabouensis]|uniref:Uncharacterized protein n=1 Tax=Leptospira bandrabouensis TaxID=2484903 RepID=A0A6H3NRY5_9LEPT|nr:hypothetical protein [Leptospira bandrabouensis]TGN09982.1 hypothetical protein EHR07_00450 [Leptospira bandrabouensis]TGN12360.1 hypothetical protein EHR08_13340 [Leptospira bandrabouensis]